MTARGTVMGAHNCKWHCDIKGSVLLRGTVIIAVQSPLYHSAVQGGCKTPLSLEKLATPKAVPDAKKVGDCWCTV